MAHLGGWCVQVFCRCAGIGRYHFTDGMDFKAYGSEPLVVDNVAAIEKERRLLHRLVDCIIVESLEFIPFSQNGDGVGLVGSLGGRLTDGNVVLDELFVVFIQVSCFIRADLLQVVKDLFPRDLWVVDRHLSF